MWRSSSSGRSRTFVQGVASPLLRDGYAGKEMVGDLIGRGSRFHQQASTVGVGLKLVTREECTVDRRAQ
jgi:hypothetical protein